VRNRSNLLVLLGIAFFVVGGLIVYVVSNDDDGGSGSNAAAGETVVVVATHDIPANAKADDEIKSGGLKEKTVSSGAVVPGAVQTLQALQGATFIQAFADGNQILNSGVQMLNRGYDLPEGYEAIALSLNFPEGVAGYVNVGDRVNLYGEFKDIDNNGAAIAGGEFAQLIMTNVRVLDISQTVPTNGVTTDPSTGTVRGGGGDITMLLAVETADAERIVYMKQGNSIYATLVRDDAPPAKSPGGIGAGNVTKLDPATSAA
jgi:Flp pilus assembly protein CpaB